ncbi:unnamed protein product [Calicophoron daubneyi]|uniref:Lipocalin/cytosolic fatty-acid binding domain-containing protein n=1 Tax=Calicophoron daubneyi TaxID=300641 RepID=A0AAV2THH5_CALDB
MAAFFGTWKLTESNNMEAIMKELNVGFMVRKLGLVTKPVVTIKANGDDGLCMKTESAFKTSELTFKYGEEIDEETPDGRTVKTTFTKDSEFQLTQIQKHPVGDTKMVRQFDGDTMSMTVEVHGVLATRKYQRINHDS